MLIHMVQSDFSGTFSIESACIHYRVIGDGTVRQLTSLSRLAVPIFQIH